MAQGASDLRRLVQAFRDAPDVSPATAVLDIVIAERWDVDRAGGALLMAVVALAKGIEVPPE
jgi:hypothetical protein